jgi:hypothetical protein
MASTFKNSTIAVSDDLDVALTVTGPVGVINVRAGHQNATTTAYTVTLTIDGEAVDIRVTSTAPMFMSFDPPLFVATSISIVDGAAGTLGSGSIAYVFV